MNFTKRPKRKWVMLCTPLDERRLLGTMRGRGNWEPPFLCSPKLDGERLLAPNRKGLSWLLSSTGERVYSLPHIEEELADLPGLDVPLDGEGYRHGMEFDGDGIHSRISRTVNLHPDYRAIEYHVFDTLDEGKSAVERQLWLREFFRKNEGRFRYVKLVRCDIAKSLEEVMRFYRLYVGHGYEGIVVREGRRLYESRDPAVHSTGMMKFKPKERDKYLVVGGVEEVSLEGEPKGRLGAFECVALDDEEHREVFTVGSGLTEEQRVRFWELLPELVGKAIMVEYQRLSSGRGVPIFGTFYSFTENLEDVR